MPAPKLLHALFRRFGDAPATQSSTIRLGSLQVIFTEYNAGEERRPYSGDPLAVLWSLWIVRDSRAWTKEDRWYFGYGEVRPWAKPIHIETHISTIPSDSRSLASETGHVVINPPLVFSRNAIAIKITNDNPLVYPRRFGFTRKQAHRRSERAAITVPATGTVRFCGKAIYFDDNDQMHSIERLWQFEGLRSVRDTGGLRRENRNYCNEFPGLKRLSLSYLEIKTSPAGVARRMRLYGKPEWSA